MVVEPSFVDQQNDLKKTDGDNSCQSIRNWEKTDSMRNFFSRWEKLEENFCVKLLSDELNFSTKSRNAIDSSSVVLLSWKEKYRRASSLHGKTLSFERNQRDSTRVVSFSARWTLQIGRIARSNRGSEIDDWKRWTTRRTFSIRRFSSTEKLRATCRSNSVRSFFSPKKLGRQILVVRTNFSRSTFVFESNFRYRRATKRFQKTPRFTEKTANFSSFDRRTSTRTVSDGERPTLIDEFRWNSSPTSFFVAKRWNQRILSEIFNIWKFASRFEFVFNWTERLIDKTNRRTWNSVRLVDRPTNHWPQPDRSIVFGLKLNWKSSRSMDFALLSFLVVRSINSSCFTVVRCATLTHLNDDHNSTRSTR